MVLLNCWTITNNLCNNNWAILGLRTSIVLRPDDLAIWGGGSQAGHPLDCNEKKRSVTTRLDVLNRLYHQWNGRVSPLLVHLHAAGALNYTATSISMGGGGLRFTTKIEGV